MRLFSTMSPRYLLLTGLLVVPVAVIAGSGGAVPVNGTMVYVQDFDSLGTAPVLWADDVTLPGWYAQINNGDTPSGVLQVSDGTQSFNGLLNLGTAGHAERALGSRAASAGNNANIAFGVQFVNTGDAPLKVARFTYTGELWRSNSSSGGRAETWTVYHFNSPTIITDLDSGANSPNPSGGDFFTSLFPIADWTSPNNLPRETAMNGNAAANRLVISVEPNLPWIYPGRHLAFKWTDTNLAGNDGYQGLDDVTVEFTSLAGVPGLPEAAFASSVSGPVYAISSQPDGKVVIGGFFATVSGESRTGIARLESYGRPDPVFAAGVSGTVFCTAVQTDGSVIAGTNASFRRAVRFFSDGTRDTAFNPDPNGDVYAIMPQPDGGLLLGGEFQTIAGAARGRIARFCATGVLDPDFNPNADANINTLAIQQDGSIIAGGAFSIIDGTSRYYLARFQPDGALDLEFAAAPNGTVNSVVLQPDGKCLIGGSFTSLNGVARNGLARLNPDGTPDAGFNPNANGEVYTIALQTDGRIVVGGQFTAIAGAPRRFVARLHGDGTVDAAFQPQPDDYIASLSLQADGKILAGGRFAVISGLGRSRFARLVNDPATQSLTTELPNRVQWLRGGSSPEVEQVRFELSTDQSASWTPLGPGTRITGGWEFTSAAALPLQGLLRARGRSSGGYRNGSSGLIETTAAYVTSAREHWRYTHFGIYGNTGDAADQADPDKDGLENLIEYAFSLNPQLSDAAALPEWQIEDNEYVLNFSRPEGVDGVTYTAEFSATMSPGSWLPAMNALTPPNYAFYTPASGQRLYVRVRVTAP